MRDIERAWRSHLDEILYPQSESLEGSSLGDALEHPDIDLELWHRSIDRILEWRPSSLGLTHFGEIDDPVGHLDLVRERLREQAGLARELTAEQFEQRIREQVAAHGGGGTEAMLQAVPPEQQWAGLDRFLRQSPAS